MEVKGKKKKNKLKVEEKGWTRSQNKAREVICRNTYVCGNAFPHQLSPALPPLPTTRKQRGHKIARSCKRQKKYKRAASHTQKKL